MIGNRKTIITLLGITLLGLLLRIWGAGHGIADELFIYPDELPFAYEVEDFANGYFSIPFWSFSPLWVYIHTLGVYLYSFLEGIPKYFFNLRQSLIEAQGIYTIILIGRVMAGISGAMTIPVVYLIGKRLLDEKTGLVGAGIMAVLYFHIAESHFAYVDVPQAFFLTVSFYFMVKVSQGEGKWDSFFSGFFLSLAIATKINAAPAFISLVFAHLLREKSTTRRGIKGSIKSKYLYISILGLIVGYSICAPYFWINPKALLEEIRFILDLLYNSQSPAAKYGGPFNILNSLVNLRMIAFEQVGPYFILLFLLIFVIVIIKREWKVFFILSFPLAYLPFFLMAAWQDQKELVPVLPFFVIFITYGLSRVIDILPFKRKEIILLVLSLFFIIPSFLHSLKADYFFWQKDTRVLAAEWIKENLPRDARIGIEGHRLYNPSIYHERYRLNIEFSKLPLDEVEKEVDFLIISDIIYGTYRDRDPQRMKYYDSLKERSQLLKVFKTFQWYFFNPKIEIYRFSRQGEASASIIPRTYSERGSYAVSFSEGAYGKEPLSFWIDPDSRIKRVLVSEKKLETIGIFLYNGPQKTRLKIRNSFKRKKITLNPYEKKAIVFEPSRSFPYTEYIHDISIKSRRGGGGTFVRIITDPKRIANALIELGDWEQAISILAKKVPIDQEAESLLGLAYSMGGKHKEALETFKKGVSPSVKELLNSKGWERTFAKLTNTDPVFLRDSLTVSYGIDQFHQSVGNKLGWMAYFNPKIDRPGVLLFGPYRRFPAGAFKAVFRIKVVGSGEKMAARIDVFNGDAILAEKLIKDTRGEFEELTLDFYNEEPDSPLEFRVEALGRRELWVEEIKVFPDLQNHYKKYFGMIHHYWGLSAGNLGLREEAMNHFNIAKELGYRDTDGLYQEAKVYEEIGIKEEAIMVYKKVLSRTPNHIDSLLALRRLTSQGATGLEEKIKALTPRHEIRQSFGDSIEFVGYSINNGKVHPGEGFKISYFWRPLIRLRANYSFFVHFRKDGATIFQNDHSPSLQTNKWKKGEVVKEDYRIEVPPDAPAGRYDIIIGLWDTMGSKERLKLKGQKIDEIKIGSIEISATPSL